MGNAKEAEAEAAAYSSHTDDLPPPPYEERDSNTNAYHAPSGVSGGSSRFPAALNAYTKKSFSRTMLLGETKETARFAMRMHSGFTKKAELVLHDGPGDDGAVLATASRESLWKAQNAVFTVPAREGGGHDAASQTVRMSTNWSLKHYTYSFEADVGAGPGSRREQFEWRSSRGSEVKGLDGYRSGWKLVRLSSQVAGGGGERVTRASGSTSDGLEIVAAWAHNNSWSMSKMFKFQLMGSALTGELGDRGAMLALLSALWIWMLELNSMASSSSAAAASSSAAAAAAASG